MTKALKVNGDYELKLFHGLTGPRIINESLEFLAFYLSETPVFSNKKYSSEYLDHVEQIVGRRPSIVSEGSTKNWWGALADLDFERWMNSKLTSAELALEKNLCPGIKILRSKEDIALLMLSEPLLLKDPFGMSGQGLRAITKQEDLALVNNFPCILEPLRKRIFDFSHYVFPDGKKIAYQNVVDQKFQYRGTLFSDLKNPILNTMSFWDEIPQDEKEAFSKNIDAIVKYYQPRPLESGFSVDSFIYEESGKLKIQALCEVNYRRTVGSTAFELAQKFSQGNWSLFTLVKIPKIDFKQMIKSLASLPTVMLLSPPDVRFQMFLISAENEIEGKQVLRELKKLLPDCQFTVNIED